MNRLLIAGNTVNGFVNCFKDFTRNSRTTFLKGGSGVGKSTFIRQVGEKAKNLGYDVVEVPCSSDINSLDAVKVYGMNIIILDATAPHIFEPDLYGVDGEIFNLGQYLDCSLLEARTGIMQDLLNNKKSAYNSMYNELKAVKNQYDNINSIYLKGFDEAKYLEIVKQLLTQIDRTCADREIKAFVDYIDSNGYNCIIDEYVDNREEICIYGRCDGIKYKLISEIAKMLDYKKIRYEKYYSILNPDRLFAIGLKNTIIYCADNGDGIDTDSAFNMSKVHYDVPLLLEHRHYINYSLKTASEYYVKARTFHKELEDIYLKAMDFKALEQDKEKYIDKLFMQY